MPINNHFSFLGFISKGLSLISHGPLAVISFTVNQAKKNF